MILPADFATIYSVLLEGSRMQKGDMAFVNLLIKLTKRDKITWVYDGRGAHTVCYKATVGQRVITLRERDDDPKKPLLHYISARGSHVIIWDKGLSKLTKAIWKQVERRRIKENKLNRERDKLVAKPKDEVFDILRRMAR